MMGCVVRGAECAREFAWVRSKRLICSANGRDGTHRHDHWIDGGSSCQLQA